MLQNFARFAFRVAGFFFGNLDPVLMLASLHDKNR